MIPSWTPSEYVPPFLRIALREPLRAARIAVDLQRGAAAAWWDGVRQSAALGRAAMLHCERIIRGDGASDRSDPERAR